MLYQFLINTVSFVQSALPDAWESNPKSEKEGKRSHKKKGLRNFPTKCHVQNHLSGERTLLLEKNKFHVKAKVIPGCKVSFRVFCKYDRIIEHLELEETHNDHQVQLLEYIKGACEPASCSSKVLDY